MGCGSSTQKPAKTQAANGNGKPLQQHPQQHKPQKLTQQQQQQQQQQPAGQIPGAPAGTAPPAQHSTAAAAPAGGGLAAKFARAQQPPQQPYGGPPPQYGAQQYGAPPPPPQGQWPQPPPGQWQQQAPDQWGQPQPQPYGQQPYGAPQQWQQGPPQQQWQQQPPQQQWGQPQQATYGAPAAAPQQQPLQGGFRQEPALAGLVASKLQNIVAANKLQAFYPPQKLQTVIDRVNGIDLRRLADEWKINVEIAVDLVSLALYDIIIYADDSSSMNHGERISDLVNIAERVASVTSLFDDDGITIRAFNDTKKGDNIKTAAEAKTFVQKLKFSGGTPMGAHLLARVLKPFLYGPMESGSLRKPLLVITITDGYPSESENYIIDIIREAKKKCRQTEFGDGSVAFEFAQVGKDKNAQDFLGRLDVHPVVGHMIDATSYFELEQEEYKKRGVALTPDLWLVKLLVGAIDQSYDEQDE